jgi:hypothetical protein
MATVAALSLAGAPLALAAPHPPSRGPSAPAPHAPQKATFGVQPATNGRPDARPYLTGGATPGATFDDSVAIVNYSLQTYSFGVYATDATNTSAGNLTLIPPGAKPTDAGSWVTIGGKGASGRITLGPKSYVVLPIHVSIPATASPGDHLAGLVAELTAISHGHNVNAKLHQRVGTRLFIRVAGTVRPALAIEHLSVSYHDNWNPVGAGSATVAYRIHNTGNVNLGARQRVNVSGLFGQVASATAPDIALLLPGAGVDVRVRVSGVIPEIWMSAKVKLTPLVPIGNLDVGVHEYSASVSFSAIPWTLIAIIVALAAVAVWFWRWRRRLHRTAGRHSSRRSAQVGAIATPEDEGVRA